MITSDTCVNIFIGEPASGKTLLTKQLIKGADVNKSLYNCNYPVIIMKHPYNIAIIHMNNNNINNVEFYMQLKENGLKSYSDGFTISHIDNFVFFFDIRTLIQNKSKLMHISELCVTLVSKRVCFRDPLIVLSHCDLVDEKELKEFKITLFNQISEDMIIFTFGDSEKDIPSMADTFIRRLINEKKFSENNSMN